MSSALLQLFFLLLFLVPVAFYLLTLQRTLQIIIPENRRMPPWQVWLLLVPFFNLIWQFVVVNKMSHSIRRECERLNIQTNQEKPTFDLGNILSLLFIVGFMPKIGFFFALCGIVCWIIYWVQIAKYQRVFIENKNNDLLDAERELLNRENL